MKKRLAIVGSKVFAIHIAEAALSTGRYDIVGFFDDFEEKGKIIYGFEVLGTTEETVDIFKQGFFDSLFIAIGYTHFDAKEKLYQKFKGLIPLETIILEENLIDKTATIGEGVFLGTRNRIGPHCVIQDNTSIIESCILGHDNILSKHSYLAGGINVAGFSVIGERCFVGIGSLIADNVEICDDVWIGLGMIVYDSIKRPGKYTVIQRVVKIE